MNPHLVIVGADFFIPMEDMPFHCQTTLLLLLLQAVATTLVVVMLTITSYRRGYFMLKSLKQEV
jgi:hypothetical protein